MDYEYLNEEEISVINNEYDYSNIISVIDGIEYLVKYLDSEYKRFISLIEEEKKKNEKFKEEFKIYKYKDFYRKGFEIHIRGASYNTITCNDFEMFQSAIANGNLNNLSSLDIELNLYFKRGKGYELVEHENLFKITFKPYDIKFVRKSNHKEHLMNEIENQINEIMKKFPVVNSIFCNKESNRSDVNV